MADKYIEALLTARLAWAWDSGCPVAGSSEKIRAQMASIVRRRWLSFERREPQNVSDEQSSRIEDLARGLCEKYERGGLSMAGPLITDYRWLAAQLAEVLANS